MNNKKIILSALIMILLVMFFGDSNMFPYLVPVVFAHCDTMSGPVIKAAKRALETGNVNHVLIWVQKKDEAEIKKAFERTLSVRKGTPEAKELADMYFYETLVRVHRAGEGEPYTGIKPANTEIEAGIVAADKAVDTGSAGDLLKEINSNILDGIRERFDVLMRKKKHAGDSVEAGREYVRAYVTFIHYVEKLFALSEESPHHGEHGHASPKKHDSH